MVPFGSRSDFFYETSHGVDRQEVICGVRQAASISHEHHFGDDTNDRRLVQQVVGELAAIAGSELRHNGQETRRVGLAITYSDGSTVTRQASRRIGSSSDFVLRDMALLALKRAWSRRTRLRSCRLICDRMHRRSPQLPLFSMEPEKKEQENVLAAMDTIRHRFGESTIHLGRY